MQHPHGVRARRSGLNESLIEIRCAPILSKELVDCMNLNVK